MMNLFKIFAYLNKKKRIVNKKLNNEKPKPNDKAVRYFDDVAITPS